ncbi:MAG: hypothetical protein KJ955_06305 [Nanoarchaeota archaeon]|nr:hypothetical protein [Nanoarchaeota archaeon]
MMMEMFCNRFPEVAEKETRCVIIPEGNPLPAGDYYMAESFCNDKKCDCRRAFINVIYNDKIIATIGFGWEDSAFYKKWAHGDKEIAVNMKGPILELGGVYTKYSERVLVLFKEIMMHDEVFLERLKDHYKMFKEALDENGNRDAETEPKKEALQGIELASLFKGSKESVVIDSNNTGYYEPLLMAIEQAIYGYYQECPSLKDKNVIASLKNVRNNLCSDFEEGSLEQGIVFGLKAGLLAYRYSEAEVLACVSKVLNSAKLHRAESGSRGYLGFISKFFDNPEKFGDEDD